MIKYCTFLLSSFLSFTIFLVHADMIVFILCALIHFADDIDTELYRLLAGRAVQDVIPQDMEESGSGRFMSSAFSEPNLYVISIMNTFYIPVIII